MLPLVFFRIAHCNRFIGHERNLYMDTRVSKTLKLGQQSNSTVSIYLSIDRSIYSSSYLSLYIYIYAVKLLSGPSLGFLEVIIWSKFVFFAYTNSGLKRFVLHTQLSFCVFFCAQLSGNFLKIAFFSKKGAKIGFFNFQCFKFKFWKFSFF